MKSSTSSSSSSSPFYKNTRLLLGCLIFLSMICCRWSMATTTQPQPQQQQQEPETTPAGAEEEETDEKTTTKTPKKTDELSLSRTELKEMYQAALLSAAVYRDDVLGRNYTQDNLELLGAWKDHDDQTLVARDSTLRVCFGAFRGTEPSAADWMQNLEMETRNIHGCTVRNGFYRGYNTNYRHMFEFTLNKCMETCPKCKMILTGHSQGGAIAVLASLFYKDNDPLVVTFGAPKAVHNPCPIINTDRHWRFVNVREFDTGMYYDMVTMITGLGADHFGHPVLLGENGSICYLGKKNDNTKRIPYGFSSHFMKLYKERMKKVVDAFISRQRSGISSFLKIGGLPNDARCGFGDECASGRCEGWIPSKRTCQPALDALEDCNEDSDCKSKKCLFRGVSAVCALPSGKMPLTGPCNLGHNCESGRCDGWFGKRACQAKLPKGERCNEDNDCQSDDCNWWFKCK